MNLDEQRIRLIDFSLEDDFLIDSELDSTSFDLRLSVAFETQNELLSTPKSRFHPEMTDRQSFFAEKGPNAIKECNARKSLAWDREFFTSPGFLELEELSLVNRGFKDLKACGSTHGSEDNVRSKICEERKLRQKPSAVVGCKNKTHAASTKGKVASPSKMTMSIQGSRRHHPTVGRSGEKSRLTHSEQVTNSRKQAVKSTGNMGQTRVSAVHIEKPPLRASTRYGRGLMSSIETGLHSSRSVDFAPCRTFTRKIGTNLLKSFEMEGVTQNSGLKEAYSQDSCSLTPENHQKNNSQTAPRKTSIKETTFSPVSSKISSLRTPSQHIGFFDMKQQKSEKGRYDKDRNKHSNKGQRKIEQQTQSLDLEEKENVVDTEDTVIELRLKKAQLGANGSSSQKSLLRTQRPKRQTMLSPAKSKTPSSAKGSVLKRSAFF